MEEILGRVNLVYENIESKSEGVIPYLLVDNGKEEEATFRLYRANVFDVNDDFFSSYDNKYVAVSGKIEMETWINVSSIREIEDNDVITTNDNNYEQL